jgi:hypothetical protein
MAFESAIQQWRAGERRLHEIEPTRVRIAERVAERVYAELRRRLGSSFLIDELVDLYDAGTAWAVDLAVAVAPADPWAWDARVAVDAAFARYAREASDYAGGRRVIPGA